MAFDGSRPGFVQVSGNGQGIFDQGSRGPFKIYELFDVILTKDQVYVLEIYQWHKIELKSHKFQNNILFQCAVKSLTKINQV